MTQSVQEPDDYSARFVIDTLPVHGRLVRLGECLSEILGAHDYPAPIANLLGEACVLAVLVGSSLKFDGRLILQAQGDGPVRYVVADYDTKGGLRGFCRYDKDALNTLMSDSKIRFEGPGAEDLIGAGTFMMTLDREDGGDRYQGITPIEGKSLSLCAEHYFAQSEQVPTRIRLCVSEQPAFNGKISWHAGGMMIQAIAEDATRGETRDAFTHISALFSTLGEDELTDFSLSSETLLYRLFHEDGVRISPSKDVYKLCRCSQNRVESLVKSFSQPEQVEMVENDGKVHITCEFCSKTFFVEI